jgi:wyosine [tRNA(Phe)-imidazoG37] synthetase (radical SAM superfamily)
VDPIIRLDIDLDALTDAMWAFVTDPHPSRNERRIVAALHDFRPETVDVMESMLLDGTEERADVAAYVSAVFGHLGKPGL